MTKMIGDSTGVPLRWIFAIAGVSVAAVIAALSVGTWVGKVEANDSDHDKRVSVLEASAMTCFEKMASIDSRLSRIEVRVKLVTNLDLQSSRRNQ